jgi:hypothetical protein
MMATHAVKRIYMTSLLPWYEKRRSAELDLKGTLSGNPSNDTAYVATE